MAFRDKYGITAIEQDPDLKSVDTFDVNWDDDNGSRKPVFLIVPRLAWSRAFRITTPTFYGYD